MAHFISGWAVVAFGVLKGAGVIVLAVAVCAAVGSWALRRRVK